MPEGDTLFRTAVTLRKALLHKTVTQFESTVEEVSAVLRRCPLEGRTISGVEARGIIASMGHSDATYEEALAGIRAGATHATHLFNAMPPIHHREPGLITACLNEPAVLAEVIPDGVHLNPHIVRLAIHAKGADRVALITDAFSATGLGEGIHTLGPHRVRVEGALCTLENGTIAGSILTMNRAVQNAMEFAGSTLVEAVRMCSLIPAQVAACAERKGSLEVGKDADVVLMDHHFHPQATWVRGRLCYSASL